MSDKDQYPDYGKEFAQEWRLIGEGCKKTWGYPSVEDVLWELRMRECDDEEIAYWLDSVDSVLGVRPLDLIAIGDVEAVYRRLRHGRSE